MVFSDSASFSTSDVYDVDDQVIRFNTLNELVWTADGAQFEGFHTNGNQIRGPGLDDWFQVYFGTEKGERRAYLGWSEEYCHCPGATPSIVDADVVDGRLVFLATDVAVPGH